MWRVLNNEIIDNILLFNNNINITLLGLKNNIEHIINDLINKKDIMYINSQLKNVNILINNILNDDIKKINNELNKIKNNDYITNIKENNNNLKNEIICIYNKQNNEINLLHVAEEAERLRNEEMEKFKEFQKRLDADNKKKEEEEKRLIQEEKDRIDKLIKNKQATVDEITGGVFDKK